MRKSAKAILSVLAVMVIALGGVAFAAEKGKDCAGKGGEGKLWKYATANFLKRLDQNKDKQISREEFDTGTMKRFETLDANRDGFVTKEEVEAAAKKLGEFIFSKADKNGDGKIGKDEFSGAPERFAALDKNNDGFLTQDELKAARHKIRERLGDYKLGKRIWARLDANKDGKISREEYQTRMNEVFRLLDRNEDGVISQADRAHRPLSRGKSSPAPSKARDSSSGPFLP